MNEQQLVNAIPEIRKLINTFRISPERRRDTRQSVHPGSRFFFDRFFRHNKMEHVSVSQGVHTLKDKHNNSYTLENKGTHWNLNSTTFSDTLAHIWASKFPDPEALIFDYEFREASDDELYDVGVVLEKEGDLIDIGFTVNGEEYVESEGFLNGYVLRVEVLSGNVVDWRNKPFLECPIEDEVRLESFRQVIVDGTQGGITLNEQVDGLYIGYDESNAYNQLRVSVTKVSGPHLKDSFIQIIEL